MKDLRTIASDPEKRKTLIKDCVELLDSEVKSKTGLSGIAVKTAYGLVKAIKPGVVEESFDNLLDDFTEVLQSYFQKYQEEGSRGTVEAYLAARSADVAESLLGITDRRAAKSSSRTMVKAYEKLRPKGKTHVESAVPRMGRMIEKHAATM
ncbi:MAG: hypothetical protein IT371_24030 [Deltaproteobacteria bacterium]|nr:hypothetical protein [Deltaproteobacteria bacterium]